MSTKPGGPGSARRPCRRAPCGAWPHQPPPSIASSPGNRRRRDGRSSATIAAPSSSMATRCTSAWRATAPASRSRIAGHTRSANSKRTRRTGRRYAARSTSSLATSMPSSGSSPVGFPATPRHRPCGTSCDTSARGRLPTASRRGRRSKSVCREVSWAKPSVTCSNGGRGSPGFSTTRASRSTTMRPSACCEDRSWAARITTARSRYAAPRSRHSSTPCVSQRSSWGRPPRVSAHRHRGRARRP
jgi:hypothetical protein